MQRITSLINWVKDFNYGLLQSEDDVETKFIIVLFQYLGYPSEYRRGKYPLKSYRPNKSGRKPEIDQIYFSQPDPKKQDENTSLVIVEAKKPGESLDDAIRQAQYYCNEVRAPLFVVTNGLSFQVWRRNHFRKDERVLECSVIDLRKEECAVKLYDYLNFRNVCRIKETSIDAVTYRQYVELTQLLERKPDIQEILSKGDFTPGAEVSKRKITRVTPKVAIECTVPAALEEGSCTIWFSSVMLQGLKIHLSHEEILRSFMLGLHTPPEWETRSFLHVRENAFEVKLGQTVLSLSHQEVVDLCTCVDVIFEKYKECIIETENVLETWNYAKEQVEGIDGYLLISVEEWVWRLMKQFSDEFDWREGDSKWHIFERGFDRIRVGRGIYDHVWLWPKSSGLFIKNGEIDIIYKPNIDPSDDEDWK